MAPCGPSASWRGRAPVADPSRGAAAQAVLLMSSTSHALRAEKLLQRSGLACKLIPVPRHLSSDCGVCLRVAAADGEAACRVLAQAGVEVLGLHTL